MEGFSANFITGKLAHKRSDTFLQTHTKNGTKGRKRGFILLHQLMEEQTLWKQLKLHFLYWKVDRRHTKNNRRNIEVLGGKYLQEKPLKGAELCEMTKNLIRTVLSFSSALRFYFSILDQILHSSSTGRNKKFIGLEDVKLAFLFTLKLLGGSYFQNLKM